MLWVFLCAALWCWCCHCRLMATPTLPRFRIVSGQSSLSGVSAGGAFAQQMHVAYSSEFIGVGSIAGPPYYCSLGLLDTATTACMSSPWLMSLDLMWSGLTTAVDLGWADSTKHLYYSRVWLYTGTLDSVVNQGVVLNGQRFYEAYIPAQQIALVDSFPSEHAWITQSYGDSCSHLGSPFINACALDAAGTMLAWIYNGTLSPPAAAYNESNLLTFSQLPFADGLPSALSLADTGYLYAPTSCQLGSQCRLHVAFHGCKMTLGSIGEDFVRNSGLNEWAETNRIVVLYPQAIESAVEPFNPEGCFEWWAYVSPEETYPTQMGLQMMAIKAMVDGVQIKKK